MGTNFYFKKKVTPADAQKVASLVNTQSVSDGSLIEAIKNLTETIHIGKASLGWKFLFNDNGKQFGINSYISWFSKKCSEYDIVDEYGSKYTPMEFWIKVLEHQTMNDYESCGTENPDIYEYYLGPLRFSTRDFS